MTPEKKLDHVNNPGGPSPGGPPVSQVAPIPTAFLGPPPFGLQFSQPFPMVPPPYGK